MENEERIIDQAQVLGHHIEILSHIKSGKEASVFRVLFDGALCAMKVYKNPDERSFQHDESYLTGKFYKKSSERRAVAKKNAFGKNLKHENWIKREFFMLQKLHAAGAVLPKPICHIEHAIIMELLGDYEHIAPRLVDVVLTEQEARRALQSVVESMKIFWNLGVVHGDLSAYNILWWNAMPYIIDFPQAIDTRNHPGAQDLLARDLKNVCTYFERYHPIDIVQLREEFGG